jgi:5S rRNA maturation endonuclease (ribonuclease M5)
LPIDTILNALTAYGKIPKGHSPSWSVCCPAHDDQHPSLSVDLTPDGKVLVYCQAGCSTPAVLGALGLSMCDLAPEERQRDSNELWTPRGEALVAYDYNDEYGTLLYQVLRLQDKGFMQRRPDPVRAGKWEWRLGNVRLVPYRLSKVIRTIRDGGTVFIVEGEKDVHAIERAGETATCNSGGAGKWKPEFAEFFDGADVVVVADKDTPGYKHARMVAASLVDHALTVRLTESASGKDVSDHLSAGLPLDELIVLDADEPEADLAPDLHEFIGQGDEYDWLVPGLLERGDRLMLTGAEGIGKSQLVQQLAVCLSAGIDPITLNHIEPLRVLLVDCENGNRHARRKLRPLRDLAAQTGRPVPAGGMRVVMKPSGVDLTTADDAAWLLERVIAHKPDVLVIGPLYRLHAQNPNDEMAARQTVAALDAARVAAQCAVILEAHAGHGEAGKKRAIRPTGSSLWLRWPEFGYGLAMAQEDAQGNAIRVDFKHWRGPRDERAWPRELRRAKHAGEWPWVSTLWDKDATPPPKTTGQAF